MHSTRHAHNKRRRGPLRVVLPKFPIATTGIHAVKPHRRMAPWRIRAFVDSPAEHLGKNSPS
jgi:hypothetical protein